MISPIGGTSGARNGMQRLFLFSRLLRSQKFLRSFFMIAIKTTFTIIDCIGDIILTLIPASLTLRRYISYYGPWCQWSYLFLFRRSLVASKRGYTASSLESVRADDPAKRTWHQCFRAVVRARPRAHCLRVFDLVQIPQTICLKPVKYPKVLLAALF